jgi:hypothetical protein
MSLIPEKQIIHTEQYKIFKVTSFVYRAPLIFLIISDNPQLAPQQKPCPMYFWLYINKSPLDGESFQTCAGRQFVTRTLRVAHSSDTHVVP